VYKPRDGRSAERYTWSDPTLVVGNIVGIGGLGYGGRYVEY